MALVGTCTADHTGGLVATSIVCHICYAAHCQARLCQQIAMLLPGSAKSPLFRVTAAVRQVTWACVAAVLQLACQTAQSDRQTVPHQMFGVRHWRHVVRVSESTARRTASRKRHLLLLSLCAYGSYSVWRNPVPLVTGQHPEGPSAADSGLNPACFLNDMPDC